jgi:hypothetical protein
MRNPVSTSLLLALMAGACFQAQAQIHHVDVGAQLPRISMLKEGTHRYLVYRATEGANIPSMIWSREVRFETVNGEKLMHIKHRFDGVLPKPIVVLHDSWFEAGNFRPRTHVRTTERDGSRVVEGFVFSPDKIAGMQDLADNTQKDLSVASPEPAFNFEMDTEFLQALPLAEGYEAHINFYHPGGKAQPQRYTFKVAGSETIGGPTGPVDCWVVTTDYNKPGGPVTKFYLAKATQLMVREENTTPRGVVYMTLID